MVDLYTDCAAAPPVAKSVARTIEKMAVFTRKCARFEGVMEGILGARSTALQTHRSAFCVGIHVLTGLRRLLETGHARNRRFEAPHFDATSGAASHRTPGCGERHRR